MFQIDVYTKKKVHTYRNGGIIPKYDEYAIKQAEKEGRVKYMDEEEYAFSAYGSTRVDAMVAVEQLSEYQGIVVSRTEFIDY